MSTENDKPLVNQSYLLEKIPGKGGWTYARVPEVPPDKHAHFGWVRVRGSIDNHQIEGYHLMPMGDGNLFLPVKVAIRKKIRKQAGDTVHVILYPDHMPTRVPEELLQCFTDEPDLYAVFLSYTEGEKKAFIDWIYSAKKDETRIERIAEMFRKLERRETLHAKTV